MRRFEFQTNLSHLWWGRKKLCFKHKNTVGLQIFVCRSIRTLDISPFPLPHLAPPPPPLNKRKKSRTENVMNAYQQHRWRDYKNVELFTLRNINWHQGHFTSLVWFINVLASVLRFCNQYSSIQSISLMFSFLFFPLTWVEHKLNILDNFFLMLYLS